MKLLLLFVFLLKFSTSELNETSACNCNYDPKFLSHYDYLGCTPVYSTDCPECISKYNCNQYFEDMESNSCKFRGKSYSIGDRMETIAPCSVCQCHPKNPDDPTGGSTFSCVNIECPGSAFGIPARVSFGRSLSSSEAMLYSDICYYSFDTHECCGKPKCLLKIEVNQTVTCNYNGRVMFPGEKYYPEDPCSVCKCSENFDPSNPAASPDCEQLKCNHNLAKLIDGCAPVYYKDFCCQMDYYCRPNAEQKQMICNQEPDYGFCQDNSTKYYFDKTSKQCSTFTYGGCGGNFNNFQTEQECLDFCATITEPSVRQENKCYFDGKNYEIGSVLNASDRITCTCVVPPIFQCMLNSL